MSRKRYGVDKDPSHRIWRQMIMRCHLASHRQFPNYGGRGITVCERWRESFQNFKEDMGAYPGKPMSLDREDNDGPYDPKNCRWADMLTQANNKRSNTRITIDGETHTAAQWARLAGLRPATLIGRLQSGWEGRQLLTPVKDTVKQRARLRSRSCSYKGEMRTEWAALFGLSTLCIQKRLDRGWTIKRALETPSLRAS
jgi:hypothetical protein